MKELLQLSDEKISDRIYFVRGKKVMLDRDLAEMYAVLTKNLNKAVKRNLRRFPEDFMFQINNQEFTNLRFQFGTSSLEAKKKWGGYRTMPYVFTEQGIAMLSSVLGSDTAIDVNIRIIRVFTKMREVLSTQKELLLRLEKLESAFDSGKLKTDKHEEEIQKIFKVLRQLIEVPPKERSRVGYKRKEE